MKESNPYQEVFSTAYARDLEPIVKVLSQQGIDYKVETLDSDYNPYLTQGRAVDAVRLLVPMSQFQEAKEILTELGLVGDISEEEGYRQMLSGLDNDELLEMVIEADLYPPMQANVAKAMLKERGVRIDERKIAEQTAAAVDSQRKPMRISSGWRILWIVLTLIGAPVAMIFSIAVLTLTGKDIQGNSYPMYDVPSKALAKILLFISIFITLGVILLRVVMFQ